MSECLNGCEYQKFLDGKFYCRFYDEELYSEKAINIGHDELIVYRCQKCIDEDFISMNPDFEFTKKIRHELNLLMDEFYSFVDGWNEQTANIFRLIKKHEIFIEQGIDDEEEEI